MPLQLALEDTLLLVLAQQQATNAALAAMLVKLDAVLVKLAETVVNQLQALELEDRKLYALVHGSGLRRNAEYPGPGWQ